MEQFDKLKMLYSETPIYYVECARFILEMFVLLNSCMYVFESHAPFLQIVIDKAVGLIESFETEMITQEFNKLNYKDRQVIKDAICELNITVKDARTMLANNKQ